jgi:hypothetical protein
VGRVTPVAALPYSSDTQQTSTFTLHSAINIQHSALLYNLMPCASRSAPTMPGLRSNSI